MMVLNLQPLFWDCTFDCSNVSISNIRFEGISYWGIANTKADDFAKGATVLDNEQLKLFQLIVRLFLITFLNRQHSLQHKYHI
jgi:hypothetical protein